MANKILTIPIWLKGIILMLALSGVTLIIIYNSYIIGFSIFIIFSVIFYFTLVKYIFDDKKIIVKYPFFYTKEYFVDEITGYTFLVNGTNIELLLFMENNSKCKIKIIGKKTRKYIETFLKEIINEIKDKNIIELKNNGIEYRLKKSRKLLFTIDYMEIDQNGYSNKYYYKKDMQNIYFRNYNGTILIEIILNNKNKLNFNDYILKGKKGLYKYLIEQINKTPIAV